MAALARGRAARAAPRARILAHAVRVRVRVASGRGGGHNFELASLVLPALYLALAGTLYVLLNVLNALPLITLNSLAALAIGIARCACATATADPRARAQAQGGGGPWPRDGGAVGKAACSASFCQAGRGWLVPGGRSAAGTTRCRA